MDSENGLPALSSISRIAEIAPEAWNACAGSDNPFVSHAFLSALEDSKSVGGRSGWRPQHILLQRDGDLIGCVPLYLKSHSYGEYVFDHHWARAYESAGGRYYPKLQCAVPFSPVPGPRLLVHPDAPDNAAALLAAGMVKLSEQMGASSIHVTFPNLPDWETLGRIGFLQRTGIQFHWDNDCYQSFDDFLAALASRKRKQIKRERKEALEGGIKIYPLTGDEIKPRHWDAFYKFYLLTIDRKWGSAYLTRSFFDLIGQRLGDRIVLVMVEKDGDLIGGALNLRGSDTLYGRNWGANGDYKFLHFEACYYQAIDYAIQHGLRRVEAGAQGVHKIQRGYRPVPTYSAHWFNDARMTDAIARFLAQERVSVEAEIAELATMSPYRCADNRTVEEI